MEERNSTQMSIVHLDTATYKLHLTHKNKAPHDERIDLGKEEIVLQCYVPQSEKMIIERHVESSFPTRTERGGMKSDDKMSAIASKDGCSIRKSKGCPNESNTSE